LKNLFIRILNFFINNIYPNVKYNQKEGLIPPDNPKKASLFYDEEKVILKQFQHIKTPEFLSNYRNRYIYKNIVNTLYDDSLKYRERAGTTCEYVYLESYYTTFTHLSESQLKYYFYWRDSFLNGLILDASLSYRFLFAYELISYSFNQSTAFNISTLVRLFDAYKEKGEYGFQQYLNNWIADMLFEVEENNLARKNYSQENYEDALYKKFKKYKDSLETLTYIDWKPHMVIRKPTMFYDQHKVKINKTFRASIPILQRLLAEKNESLEDRWFDKRKEKHERSLFQGAVLGRDSNINSISYTINSVNVSAKLSEDLTQLYRLAENVIREILGEKRMIKVTEDLFPARLKEELIRLKIEEQIAKENKKKKPSRFVKVKGGEGKTEGGMIPQPPKEETLATNSGIILEFNDDRIKMLSNENDAFQKLFQQYEEVEREPSNSIIKVPLELGKLEITPVFSVFEEEPEEDVQEFIDKLNEGQKQFLHLFDNGKLDQKSGNDFIKSQKSMPSVYLDSLNEVAKQTLGDILVEQDESIYVMNEDLCMEEILLKMI
jgi:hypothetical protein